MYPVIIKDRTLVPVREIMESTSLDASVEWIEETKTVIIRKGDKTVTLSEGDSRAYVNGVEVGLDSEAKLIKDKDVGIYKFMVPIRFITENFGYDVEWNKESQEVILTNLDSVRASLLLEDSNVTSLTSAQNIQSLPTNLKANPLHIEALSKEEYIELKDGESNSNHEDTVINDIIGNADQSKFYIQADGPISDIEYSVSDDKLIIDIDGLIMNDFPTVIRMDDGVYVSAVRTNQSDDSPYKARIVFDLYDRSTPREINFSPGRTSLEVTFNEEGLDQIDITQDDLGDIITLDGDFSDYNTFRINEPNALVFDLNNCDNLLGNKNILDVKGQSIDNIYIGTKDSKTTRMIIESVENSSYDIYYNQTTDKTTIRIVPLAFSQISFDYEEYPRLIIPKSTDLVGFDINQITTMNTSLGFVTQLSFNQTITELNKNQKFYLGDKHTDQVEVVTSDGNTSIIFTNRHIIEYQISEDENNLYITGIRPKDLYGTMVLLDAGHGGYQPGAVYNGLLEKDVNLKLMTYIRQFTELREDIKYFYTRIDDTDSTLPERVIIANDLEVDLLLSMHNNAIDIKNNPSNTSIRGMEVITTIDTETSADEIRLATIVFADMALGLPGLALKEIKDYNKLYLLRYSNMPAVIIEYGYLTNEADVENLKQEWILEEAARITEEAIYKYFH